MKNTFLALLFLTSYFGFGQTNEDYFKKMSTFLSTFVNQGLVDYTAIKSIGQTRIN